MRLLAAACLLLVASGAQARSVGTNGNSRGTFGLAFIPDTQHRIDFRSTNVTTGVPTWANDALGDETAADGTDSGWLYRARATAPAGVRYPAKLHAVVMLGDVANYGGDVKRDLMINASTDSPSGWGCEEVSGHFWAGNCHGALAYPYVRMREALDPLVRQGQCVIVVPGNHDIDCGLSGAKNRDPTLLTSASCDTLSTGDTTTGYDYWASLMHLGELMAKTCPQYQDDCTGGPVLGAYAAGAGGYPGGGVACRNAGGAGDPDYLGGHVGSRVGNNQTAVIRVGSQDVRIITLNVQMTGLENAWVTNILDNDSQPGSGNALPTIIITHVGMCQEGDYECIHAKIPATGGGSVVDMAAFWANVQLNYPNVFLFVGGHEIDLVGGDDPVDLDIGLGAWTFAHTGVGEEGFSTTHLTCNFQGMTFDETGDVPLCTVRVDPVANQLCWEVVVPSWEMDTGTPAFKGLRLSDSVGAGERLNLLTASDTHGCFDLDWVGGQ